MNRVVGLKLSVLKKLTITTHKSGPGGLILFMNNQVLDHNGNEIEIEAFHPGGFLREEIEERNILKKDVAKAIGILPHHLSEIFIGKRNISATLAVKLEKFLGISSHYWLGMQMEYDLFIAKQAEELV
jgi:addiction module HigA family antidote